MSFNKIILVGNLGKDPDLRYTPQGVAVCTFSMATNEKRRDKSGEYQNIATWFKVTLWGHVAENAAKYLTKSSPVYIEGRLRIEEWTDRENNRRYSLEVNGTDMQFLANTANWSDDQHTRAEAAHQDEQAEKGYQEHVANPAPSNLVPDNDIPF